MPSSSTRTLAPRVAIGEYPRGDGVTVAAALAAELGCTIPTARKRLYVHPKLADVAAAAIRSYHRAGDLHGLARFLAPIEASIAGCFDAPFTDATVLQAQDADSREELAVEAYLLRPSEATARAAVRAIDKERAEQLRLRSAIAARHGIS